MEEYQSLEKAISYCIENFSKKEATKRIVDYIKSDREITEKIRNIMGDGLKQTDNLNNEKQKQLKQ